jgi:hypothetical protein
VRSHPQKNGGTKWGISWNPAPKPMFSIDLAAWGAAN